MADGVSPEVARESASIARQTMSPFCPGRTLADCPSPSAAEWRREIEVMVAEGREAPEIQALLSERAALDLSGSPQKDASYAVPLVLTAAALLLLAGIFLRLRVGRGIKPAPNPSEKKGTELEGLDERLDDELEHVK